MSTTGGRKAKADGEREMVELVDPDGQPFSTGHMATVNSLLMNGYSLKKDEPIGEIQERLAPQQGATTTDGAAKK